MRRRRLLAALGASAITGCTALASRRPSASGTAPPPDPYDDLATTVAPSGDVTDTTNTGDDWLSDRRIVEQRTVDRTLALAPTRYSTADRARVELGFAAPATGEHPAVVRATLTNENEFENTFRLRETPPFGPRSYATPRTTADRLGLYLVPTANHPLRRSEPGFTRTPDGRWLLSDAADWLPETVTLDPGETVRGEYHLVGHPESERPPVGRYEIAAEFALALTAWPTTGPGPTADSRFAGADVPPLFDDRRVNWFHEADAETPVYVEPATERARLPAALRFVLHNHSRTDLECESFAVYRLDGDDWRRLGRGYAHNACWNHPPGDRTTFWLRAFPGKVAEALPGARSLADLSVEPGTFAFTLTYGETYGAVFELRGPEEPS